MTDYSKAPAGILDAIGRRDGTPIYYGVSSIADGGYLPWRPPAAAPQGSCAGCGAHDFQRGVCTYCRRPG